MAQSGVVNYLNEQKQTPDKDLAAEWGVMEELYNEKWVVFVFRLVDEWNLMKIPSMALFPGCGMN